MLKKNGLCFFLLGLFVMVAIITSGCSQQVVSTPILPQCIAASSIGSLGTYSLSADNSIASGTNVAASGIRAAGYSTPEVGSDDWWQMTYAFSYGDYTYDMTFSFKLWDKNGTVINTSNALDNLGTSDLGNIWIYGILNITYAGTSYEINIGSSKSNPFKYEGYNASSLSLSGPVSHTGSYENLSYTVTATYNNLTVSTGGTSGYPTGTVNVSIAEGGNTVSTATITFDGDNTASLVFTSGYSGTYSINLDDGTVTAASL